MKRHISLFVFFCLPGAFLAGCSDADRSSLMGEEEVPVELSALEGDVSSRAAVSAGSKPQAEFEAAMVFSRTAGDYTTPVVAAEEGVWKGTVGTNGEVSWGNAGKDAPIYPRWGAWLYLVSYAPMPSRIRPLRAVERALMPVRFPLCSQGRPICFTLLRYRETAGRTGTFLHWYSTIN